ncbi:peroxiredoxin [Labrys wisconsinensis]|uniref:Glutathione-dependent peroxiredoxin n=1 Tax=Labrys wisconsinensis TaxID=425677 RepID=A0ABU0JB46_9HYPH|nr:peroxiredoxin [Labrys wisconsinensis]MDQ0470387.1 peroxiredoxin [Labrys wisconsinensis]
MTIKPGDRLPETAFRVTTPDGVVVRSTADVFNGRKVVLFAVPGAFTPTCHKNHLPGFLTAREEILAKGVDAIAVTAVNDPFVMDAWAKATGAAGKIEFLADGSGDFAKAIGMDLDVTARGLGLRSQRYAMVVDDGVVTLINKEENPSQADVSSAATLLQAL